jgi:FkbH-like protein
MTAGAERARLRQLLLAGQPDFWGQLAEATLKAGEFDELIFLSSLRKKAAARGLPRPPAPAPALRIALLSGFSAYPLRELVEHVLATEGIAFDFFVGEYDNYAAEVLEAEGPLYQFKPQVILLLPGPQRCRYAGDLLEPREQIQAAADAVAGQLLELCRVAHERTGAEILLGNFPLPARRDPGPFRSRTLASDWNFRKWVNLELGLKAPAWVRICDLEYLACRRGALASEDPRGWFESKQPGSPGLLLDLARELAGLIRTLRQPTKKVLVLDLDNTLWGGVLAEDGLDGIEIGDTSPRGEAFKAFQKYILTLKQRGVLLAVCSKNDRAPALEPFEKHPEMVLRPADFAAFTANWEPKSDNLRSMAHELNLGLDSFVFVDDNPAEIEIVRRFTPAVTAILLPPDPAEYVGRLQDCGCFEPHRITAEDRDRTGQYRAERERQAALSSAADMDVYLDSLAMKAVVRHFAPTDVPRLAQLINKSNQFNLTTKRRTEAEVGALIGRSDHVAFSVRLADRFGDYGLISILIGRVAGPVLEIDTWIMSCRVLKRQVEELVLNTLVQLARERQCVRIAGLYVPTAKNDMVRDFYPRMGFAATGAAPDAARYELDLDSFHPRPTKIELQAEK